MFRILLLYNLEYKSEILSWLNTIQSCLKIIILSSRILQVVGEKYHQIKKKSVQIILFFLFSCLAFLFVIFIICHFVFYLSLIIFYNLLYHYERDIKARLPTCNRFEISRFSLTLSLSLSLAYIDSRTAFGLHAFTLKASFCLCSIFNER